MEKTGKIVSRHLGAIALIAAGGVAVSAVIWPCVRGRVVELLYPLAAVAAGAAAFVLELGVLRSAREAEGKPASVKRLFAMGQGVVWSEIGVFGSLAMVFSVVLALLSLLAHLMKVDRGDFWFLPWNSPLIVVSLALILKPLILVPAVLILMNCAIPTAIGFTRLIPLRSFRRIWVLVLVQAAAVVYLVWLRTAGGNGETMVDYAMRVLAAGAATVANVLMYLEAMQALIRSGLTGSHGDVVTAPPREHRRRRRSRKPRKDQPPPPAAETQHTGGA